MYKKFASLWKIVLNYFAKIGNSLGTERVKTKQRWRSGQNQLKLNLKLPELSINSINIKRTNSMKFLGVILDQHLDWKEDLKLIENKTSKCIGIMYKVEHLLKNKFLQKYLFCIHSYEGQITVRNHVSFFLKSLKSQKNHSEITEIPGITEISLKSQKSRRNHRNHKEITKKS